MSGLQRFQNNPKYLLGNAYQLYKSRRIRTIVIEGLSDKRFLEQWTNRSSSIRFDGLDGKKLVTDTFQLAQNDPYNAHKFLLYFADLDWDIIHSKPLIECAEFIYNAYCGKTKKPIFNDLECFLINTRALEKAMANLDMNTADADQLREKIEYATRQVGAFRAADEIVRKKLGKSKSILNGLEPSQYFDANRLSMDIPKLTRELPRWANYKEHVDDLIECANELLVDHTSPWSLSRGHDVTELFCEHFITKGAKGLRSEKFEMMLRLGCEMSVFKESPMGINLQIADTDKAFFTN
jgi:hypothetical protein